VTDQNYRAEYNLITRYEYDEFGRQTAITDTLGHATRTIYADQTGRVERTIANYENGVYTSLKPDEDIVTEYVYDANGNVVQTIEFPDNLAERRVTCTVYDDLNRVKRTVQRCGRQPD
jgi:YD repeat-containing protein